MSETQPTIDEKTANMPAGTSHVHDELARLDATLKQIADSAAAKREKDAEIQRQEEDARQQILERLYDPDKMDFTGHSYFKHFPKVIQRVLRDLVDKGDRAIVELGHITNEDRSRLQQAVAETPASEVVGDYLQLHNANYLNRLNGLVGTVPSEKSERFNSYPAVVCISARNEVDISKAIAALKTSYGDSFEQDVGVVVYHNFTDRSSIPKAVQDCISQVTALPNVAVIEEEISDNVKLAEVKKTAADCVLTLSQNNPDQTLIFTDADLTELSPGAIQIAISARNESPLPLSVFSTAQYPDREIQSRFPLFYARRMLHLSIQGEKERRGYPSFAMLGSFAVMDKKSFTSCGGWIPNQLHEDMLFNYQIKLAAASYYSGQSPVIAGSYLYDTVSRFNSDKDILAIFHDLEKSRFSGDIYHEMSGKLRSDWRQIPQSEEPTSLLTATLTPEGIMHVARGLINSRNLEAKLSKMKESDIQEQLITQEMVVKFIINSGQVRSIRCRYINDVGKPETIILDANNATDFFSKNKLIVEMDSNDRKSEDDEKNLPPPGAPPGGGEAPPPPEGSSPAPNATPFDPDAMLRDLILQEIKPGHEQQQNPSTPRPREKAPTTPATPNRLMTTLKKFAGLPSRLGAAYMRWSDRVAAQRKQQLRERVSQIEEEVRMGNAIDVGAQKQSPEQLTALANDVLAAPNSRARETAIERLQLAARHADTLPPAAAAVVGLVGDGVSHSVTSGMAEQGIKSYNEALARLAAISTDLQDLNPPTSGDDHTPSLPPTAEADLTQANERLAQLQAAIQADPRRRLQPAELQQVESKIAAARQAIHDAEQARQAEIVAAEPEPETNPELLDALLAAEEQPEEEEHVSPALVEEDEAAPTHDDTTDHVESPVVVAAEQEEDKIGVTVDSEQSDEERRRVRNILERLAGQRTQDAGPQETPSPQRTERQHAPAQLPRITLPRIPTPQPRPAPAQPKPNTNRGPVRGGGGWGAPLPA